MSNSIIRCAAGVNVPSHRHQHSLLRSTQSHSGRQEGGYILIAAIVVMLVLSGIALTLAKLSISQSNVVEQSLLRVRTELALESAAQWITQVTLEPPQACVVAPDNNIYFDESGLNVGGFSAYTVNTVCISGLQYNEGGIVFNRFPTQLQADYKEQQRNGAVRSMVVRRSVLEY